MQSGTNLPRVRDYNQGVVLDAIRVGSGISRVEIAEQSGLTAQTVSNIVRRLLDEGLVIEDGVDPSGRKPRIKLWLNSEARYAVGALLDRDEIFMALVGLDGRILARAHRPVDQQQGAMGVVSQIVLATELLVTESGVARDKLVGFGLGCPGPMDHDKGVLYEPLDLFGLNWHAVEIKEALHQQMGLPVIVDNDATAAAIGERWLGGRQRSRNFAFIFMGMGIGAGFFIENQIYRGDTTNAGEIGHMTLNPEGPECFCGSRGCLELYSAPSSILKSLRQRLQEGEKSSLQLANLTFDRIGQAAQEGDELALEVIQNSARMLGYGLINMINLLDLRLIVLGGRYMRHVAPFYQAEIQKIFNQRLLTRNVRGVDIEISIAGEDAGAVGAASLVFHELFSARLTELRLVP